MQIIFLFTGTVKEYTESFQEQTIEKPKRCIKCGCTKIYKWGTYKRYVAEEGNESQISIHRVCCAHCHATSSYLPDFCLSRIQYSTDYVMKLLEMIIRYGKKYREELKEQIYFYKRRFLEKINLFITFLRGKGIGKLSSEPKERAIEIFDALYTLHRAKELLTSFFKDTSKHFMAK